ncbi:MAG: DMT family transporter [Pseudomonadota bacterium]
MALQRPHLELSIAAAAYYTLPIFITLFSSMLIGDRISFSGWLAVMIGFLGVLLILRPNAEDFNFYALLPLISAVLYALAMILTRTKCQMVHPIILSIALNVSFIVVGTVAAASILIIAPETRDGFIWGPWAEMGNAEWLSMTLLAAAILIGSVGAAIAYQYGRPTIVGIFDFAYVGFAVLWGFIFFAEVPDLLSIAGITMIVVAGVLSLRQ